MKKFALPLFLIIIMAGTVAYYYFNVIPKKISNKILAKNLTIDLTEAEREVLGIDSVKQIPLEKIIQSSLQENDLKVDELIQIVENIEPSQVKAFMDECAEMKRDSISFTLHQVKTHFDLGVFPIDSFQTEFEILYDPIKMDQALALYEKNKDQLPLILPLLKKSAIRFLKKIETDTVQLN